MIDQQKFVEFLARIRDAEEIILVILSAPRKTGEVSKVMIRPVQIKGRLTYQMTEHRKQQVVHQNLSKKDCLEWLKQHISDFRQTFFYTTSADFHLLVNKKGNMTLLTKPPSKPAAVLSHNRSKVYLLQEGIPVPFLVHLGVMSPDGKVHAEKRDKFRQINRFLEMIDDILPHLDVSRPLKIIDFGCGKAYLTFALYHFLKVLKGYQVCMIGLDLKSEVIHSCQELSEVLGCQEDIQFVLGDINDFHFQGKVDMMVSLHACDTATDAALEKAIRWKAQVILCVPCCQHELMHQVHHEALSPILKHGILKERFAALATDAARVQLLEVLGYQTQILEFIDMEHTPKNLLIRAVKRTKPGLSPSALQTYLVFKEELGIEPSLERRFKTELL